MLLTSDQNHNAADLSFSHDIRQWYDFHNPTTGRGSRFAIAVRASPPP